MAAVTRARAGIFLVILLAVRPAGAQPSGTPQDPLACEHAASSLYCADLVPTPDLRQIAGRLDVLPVVTPFGAAVTADGAPRFSVAATIRGLPPADRLGPYRVYVAWAATVTMDREVRLGTVTDGRSPLGEVSMAQFRILVTAEASPDVRTRQGKVVLRGTSPMARLLAHRDVMAPVASGVVRAPEPAGAPADHSAHHHVPSAGPGLAWRMPPMLGLPMMPGMGGLVPTAGPYLPGAGLDPSRVAAAQPRQVLTLKSGDTLRLDARLVRRTIGSRTFVMYGFNGQYPGPLIQVAQKSTVTVVFTNNLDMPTAVHWHGLRLDNRSDGVPGVTQEPIAPGATFTYTLHFPDAGIYWYHPHVREDIQQDLGLYGNILVAPSDPGYYAPVNREETLLLDDFLMDAGGPYPYGKDAPTHALMGRFGNVFLVNGEPEYRMTVRRGEVVRFYLTNVSSARLYNLSFGGARIKVIGSDVGKFEHEAWVTSVVLAPAERYIVEVQFTEPGETALVNAVQSLNHMSGSFFSERHTLARIRVLPETADPDHSRSFGSLRKNVDVAADIAPYRDAFSRAVDKELHLTLRIGDVPPAVRSMLQGVTVPLEWNDGMPMENWLVTGKEAAWILREPATGRENMDVNWRFRQGDLVKLRVFNDPASPHPMSHPIHLHGQRFLILSRNGIANDNLVWKDTFLVAAGETVDILVELSNPGKWMLHCHVAEHLGAGMMMVFQVDPRTRGK